MIISKLSTQLLSSVTVTVYVPADKLLKSSSVDPLLHKIVFDGVPPVITRSIEPFPDS